VPKFKAFQEIVGWDYRKMGVYVLCNFDTTLDQDLERIYTLRTSCAGWDLTLMS